MNDPVDSGRGIQLGDTVLVQVIGSEDRGWCVGTWTGRHDGIPTAVFQEEYFVRLATLFPERIGGWLYIRPDFIPLPRNCSGDQLQAIRSLCTRS